jgi:hypothetical protein
MAAVTYDVLILAYLLWDTPGLESHLYLAKMGFLSIAYLGSLSPITT